MSETPTSKVPITLLLPEELLAKLKEEARPKYGDDPYAANKYMVDILERHMRPGSNIPGRHGMPED